MWKKKYSNGDYKVIKNARTFETEFYYINFIDRVGKFDSAYSEEIDERNHAFNRARWITNNSWFLSRIPYKVEKVGVYSSLKGHVKSFALD